MSESASYVAYSRECPGCFEKEPEDERTTLRKVLPCSCAVCEGCFIRLKSLAEQRLESHYICPSCRQSSPISVDPPKQPLPPKPFSNRPCANCKAPANRECLSCGLLCENCNEAIHKMPVFASHPRGRLGQLENAKCPHHPSQLLTLYCNEDKELACAECILSGPHRVPNGPPHECIPFDQAASSLRLPVNSGLNSVQSLQSNLEAAAEKCTNSLSIADRTFAATRSQIESHFISLQQRLEKRKNSVLNTLKQMEIEWLKRVSSRLSSVQSYKKSVSEEADAVSSLITKEEKKFLLPSLSKAAISRLEDLLSLPAHLESPLDVLPPPSSTSHPLEFFPGSALASLIDGEGLITDGLDLDKSTLSGRALSAGGCLVGEQVDFVLELRDRLGQLLPLVPSQFKGFEVNIQCPGKEIAFPKAQIREERDAVTGQVSRIIARCEPTLVGSYSLTALCSIEYTSSLTGKTEIMKKPLKSSPFSFEVRAGEVELSHSDCEFLEPLTDAHTNEPYEAIVRCSWRDRFGNRTYISQPEHATSPSAESLSSSSDAIPANLVFQFMNTSTRVITKDVTVTRIADPDPESYPRDCFKVQFNPQTGGEWIFSVNLQSASSNKLMQSRQLAAFRARDLSWMERGDAFHGFKQSSVYPNICYAVSKSNVWDVKKNYEVPKGYRICSTTEASSIFGFQNPSGSATPSSPARSSSVSSMETPLSPSASSGSPSVNALDYIYYNAGNWEGCFFKGVERKYFRFSDSVITGSYRDASNRDGPRVGFNHTAQLFAGFVCVKETATVEPF